MVEIPAGFDIGALVSDFSGLGVYIIGVYVLIAGAGILFRALGSR